MTAKDLLIFTESFYLKHLNGYHPKKWYGYCTVTEYHENIFQDDDAPFLNTILYHFNSSVMLQIPVNK